MLMICLVRAYLDKQALEDLYDVLVRKYEKVKVTKFKKNANLGMFANFQQPEVVIIGNPGFMIDIMKEYGEVTTSTTPADENLFNVRDSPLLPAADAKRFHSFVAKLLYLSKRTRPDILTLVAFLTTREQSPTEDDKDFIEVWDILLELLSYL